MDLDLARVSSFMIYNVLIVLSCFITVCYSIGLFSILNIFLIIYGGKIIINWLGPNREIRRMENNSLTPLYNHLTETFEGLDQILLAQREQSFIKKNYYLMDQFKNLRMNLSRSWGYFALKNQSILLIVTILAFTSCVLYAYFFPNRFSNQFAALTVSLSMQINLIIGTCLESYTRFEMQLSNLERVIHLIK